MGFVLTRFQDIADIASLTLAARKGYIRSSDNSAWTVTTLADLDNTSLQTFAGKLALSGSTPLLHFTPTTSTTLSGLEFANFQDSARFKLLHDQQLGNMYIDRQGTIIHSWKGLDGGQLFAPLTSTDSSGAVNALSYSRTYNQTSGAGSTDFQISRVETALGSGAHYFLNLLAGSAGTTQKAYIKNDGSAFFAGPVVVDAITAQYTLDVNGYIRTSRQVAFTLTGGPGFFGNFENPSGTEFGFSKPNQQLFTINIATNNSYFPIGNVGFGTSSPASLVDLFGSATQTWSANSSTSTKRTQATQAASWIVNTDASRTARIVYSVYDTAAREFMRADASGTAAKLGFFGASAVAQQSAGTVATDAASTQTLANALRSALVNLGLAA